MEKHKKVLSFLPYILNTCISIYLTYLIDAITLNTIFEKIFVFVFFILSTSILFFLFKKYIGLDFSIKLIASSVIASISIIILFGESFFPQKRQNVISFEAQIEENANHGQEVWLSKVVIDGKATSISNLNAVYNEGWEYIPNWDNYVFYPTGNISPENTNGLKFNIVCKSAEFVFSCNSWSGKVSYNLNDSDNYETLELYSADNLAQPKILALDLSVTNSPLKTFFCLIGAMLSVFFFVYQSLTIVKHNFARRKKETAFAKFFIDNCFIFSICFLLTVVLFEILEKQYNYIPENITVFVGFLMLLIVFPCSHRLLLLFKKIKIAEILLLILVSFIIAFQTVSEIIFMPLDKISISFVDVFTFIIAAALVTVFVLTIMLFIDKHTQKRFEEGGKVEKE